MSRVPPLLHVTNKPAKLLPKFPASPCQHPNRVSSRNTPSVQNISLRQTWNQYCALRCGKPRLSCASAVTVSIHDDGVRCVNSSPHVQRDIAISNAAESVLQNSRGISMAVWALLQTRGGSPPPILAHKHLLSLHATVRASCH